MNLLFAKDVIDMMQKLCQRIFIDAEKKNLILARSDGDLSKVVSMTS